MKTLAELEIEGLPETTNEQMGLHWAIKARQTKKWHNLVRLAAVKAGIANSQLNKASLTLTRLSSHQADHDGLVSSFKRIIDGLKVSGVIIDDNPDVIGSPIYLWEKGIKGKGKIKIKIEVPEHEPAEEL